MLKKSVKITIEIASIASIISMLAIAGLFIWVLLSPRTVFFIKPYLEKELSSINTKFKVKIDESIIKWDSQQRTVAIHMNNVKVTNDTNDTIATIPEISFGFSMLRFLSGHLLSSDLAVLQPSIYLNTSSKILYVTPDNKSAIDGIIFNALHTTLASNDYSFKIHSVRVKDARIFISTSDTDMLWRIDDGYAKLLRIKGKNKIKSEFKVNFGKDSTYFDVNAAASADKSINTEVHFKNLPGYTLSDLFPDYKLEQRMNMSFSGRSNIIFSENGVLSGVNFSIDSASGIVNLPEIFKDTIDIENLSLDARLYDNLSRIAIDNMELDLNGPTLKVSGSINNISTWPEIMPSIDLYAEISDLEASDIESYWPYQIGAVAREWVTANIKTGTVPSAKGKFKFSSEDIKNIIEKEKSPDKDDSAPIPDSAIDATINIENANVNYMDKYPPAEDVEGVVKFTGQSMDASVTSARILNTDISNAHVKFDNLWENQLKIGIAGDFNGDAQNMVKFLKLSYKEKPENKTMASIYNINGQTSGSINTTIPIIPNLKYDDVDIKISSNFKNSLLKEILNGKDIATTNLLFELDKYNITAKGDILVNNVPASIELHKNLSPTRSDELSLKVKGDFLPSDIKDLGIAEIPFVTGKMGLDVNIVMKNNSATISGITDLTQSTVKIDDIGFQKLAGKNGKAEFNIIKSGNENIDINEFKLQGDGFFINGTAKISPEVGGITDLSISSAKFLNSDFTSTYKSTSISNIINVSGNSLNISKAKISEWFRQDPSKIKKSLVMNVALKNLYIKNGEVLKDFSSDLHCSAQACTNGNLHGKIREANFVSASLKKIGDRSAMVVESDNAGAIINALNISQNIIGGHLEIDSSLTRINGATVSQGLIKIADFTAIRTPLLGKILTLASFRGFEDLLNNEGISFKKFEAPFTMANGVITVTKAKSSGASIGITADGTIDTARDEVDLKGVIVPAYAVNNIIGKIPFVGKIIIGKENEGIIATKYSLRGSYDDAKVSVNPLSILAPGFIRNIFDIFD